MKSANYILFFNQISISDIAKVGGKNASLGEWYNQLNPKGIGIPDGFALTADAYRLFLEQNDIDQQLNDLLLSLDTEHYSNLISMEQTAKALMLSRTFPSEIIDAVNEAYLALSNDCGINNLDVAVGSSATTEDLPTSSFAGRMESFLNISGEKQLLEAFHRYYASIFTDHAIKYPQDMGITRTDVAISVGLQQMVRSDKVSSSFEFTIDLESEFENGMFINHSWGLGENIKEAEKPIIELK